MRCFHFLLHPEIPVHVFNVTVLLGVIPYWLANRPSSMISGAVTIPQLSYTALCMRATHAAELFDAFGDASGIACKIMLGLCLLPIARRSVWLDAAASGNFSAVTLIQLFARLSIPNTRRYHFRLCRGRGPASRHGVVVRCAGCHTRGHIYLERCVRQRLTFKSPAARVTH
jgi:hypothetical protein